MAIWIVPLISALLVFLSSAFAYFHSRRSLVATVITQQRLQWISDIRTAVAEFISIYLKENDEITLWEKKVQIELYLSPKVEDSEVINASHQKVAMALEGCVTNNQPSNEVKIKHANKLVYETKMMLRIAWIIMKKEAVMSNLFEKRRGKAIKELLQKHYPHLYKCTRSKSTTDGSPL